MKIDAPGGKTADLHRRVWVGVGRQHRSRRICGRSLRSLGVESDFDIATPWTSPVFKSQGGSRAYFHGGLSPQELIIPVLTLTPKAQPHDGPPTGIKWTLTHGLEEADDPVLLRADHRQPARASSDWNRRRCGSNCGRRGSASPSPVSASYGFEEATGDVKLKIADRRQQANRTEHRHRDGRRRGDSRRKR